MHFYLITGLLLYLAEPPLGLWPLAFIALIPAMYAAQRARTYRSAALGGFLAGVTFFSPGLFWLTSTTIIGWTALALYCATYIAIFAVLARATSNVLALAAGWILLEVVRGAIAFTAFTQILDVVGSYGLSGLLIVMNSLIWKGAFGGKRKNLWVAAGILVGVCLYGYI